MMTQTENAKLLKAKISEYDTIIIAKHTSPDWDAVGSAKGLREIILDNFANKQVFVVGHEYDSPDLIDDALLTDEMVARSLLITVDVANIERVDFDRVQLTRETFRVDHHINNAPYTDYEYIFDHAIACTQVITLWAAFHDMTISKKAAEFLYRGLVTDSNRFFYKNTNEDTFLAAQILCRAGIDIVAINHELYTRTLKHVRWTNYAFSLAEIDEENGIGYIKLNETIRAKFDLTPDELKSAVGVLGNIKEIKIWFLAYELATEDGIKLSIRSRSVPVNTVAENYGGGGHKLACGAYLKNWNELEDFLTDIRTLLKEEQ